MGNLQGWRCSPGLATMLATGSVEAAEIQANLAPLISMNRNRRHNAFGLEDKNRAKLAPKRILLMISTFFLLTTLCLASREAFGGTADPSGVSVLIFGLVVLLLFLVSSAVGGLVGGKKGAVFSVVVVFGGIWIWGTVDEYRMHKEYIAEKDGHRRACISEAGEFGKSANFPVNKIFLSLDDHAARNLYPSISASPLVSRVNAMPTTMSDNQVYVSITFLNQPIEGAGTRHLRGYKTSVISNRGVTLAERVNFACFQEVEAEAVESFLSRTFGMEIHLLSHRPLDAPLLTPKEYPVAQVRASETGSFEVNESSVGRKKIEQLPNEWGCLLKGEHSTISPPQLFCPNADGELKEDLGLARASIVHNLGSSWIVVQHVNQEIHGFVVEERYPNRRIKRIIHVRLPDLNLSPYLKPGDIRSLPEGIEIVWLGEPLPDRKYKRRFAMVVPI